MLVLVLLRDAHDRIFPKTANAISLVISSSSSSYNLCTYTSHDWKPEMYAVLKTPWNLSSLQKHHGVVTKKALFAGLLLCLIMFHGDHIEAAREEKTAGRREDICRRAGG